MKVNWKLLFKRIFCFHDLKVIRRSTVKQGETPLSDFHTLECTKCGVTRKRQTDWIGDRT